MWFWWVEYNADRLIAGGVSRGETTSGEASKARNEAVVIAG